MAEIINLRRVRKAKAKAEREADAEANRRKFGRPKDERLQSEAEAEIVDKKLDAHKLDKPEPDTP